jgi:hypothetical protein
MRGATTDSCTAEACNGTNNDVNMQGTRHCNRHQLQKQQQDQRVKRRDRSEVRQQRLEERGQLGSSDKPE